MVERKSLVTKYDYTDGSYNYSYGGKTVTVQKTQQDDGTMWVAVYRDNADDVYRTKREARAEALRIIGYSK